MHDPGKVSSTMSTQRRAQLPNWRCRRSQTIKCDYSQQQQQQEQLCSQQEQQQQNQFQHQYEENLSVFENRSNNNIRFGAIFNHFNKNQSNCFNKQGFQSYSNEPLTFGNFIHLKKFKHYTEDYSDANDNAHGIEKRLSQRHVMNISYDIHSRILPKRNYQQRSKPFWQPMLCFNDINDELKCEKAWDRIAININGDDRYLLEIDRGLNGYITRYPRCVSRGYQRKAENYSVYGLDFFDFPQREQLRNGSYLPKLFDRIHCAKMFQNGRCRKVLRDGSFCHQHVEDKVLRFDTTEPATFNLNSASFPPLPTRLNDDRGQ